MKLLFLVFYIYSFSLACFAETPPVLLKDGKEFYELGLHLDILEDPTRKLSIDDVNSSEWASKFQKSQKNVLNFGFSTSAFWARLKISNQTKDQKKWLLSSNYYMQDEITFYKKTEGGWIGQTTGDTHSFKTREVEARSFVFKIKPLQSVYFIRIQGAANRLNLTLQTPESFAKTETKNHSILGLYFGLIGALVLYNFFIFISTKSQAYLYYILYVLFFGLFQAYNFGFGQRFLFGDYPWLSNNGSAIFIGLTELFLCLFTIAFLKLKESSPLSYKIMRGGAFISLLSILSSLIFSFTVNVKFVSFLAIVLLPSIFIVGIQRVKMGYRPAQYFSLAFGTFFVGSFILAFTIIGVIPSTFLIKLSPVIGSALELVLLSMGLADRFNFQQEEALRLEEKAHDILKISLEKEKKTSYHLKLSALQREEDLNQLTFMYDKVKETNELLEEKVEERTEKLNDSLLQLKKSISDKSTFYAKVSHELRTPLNGILGFSQILLSEVDREIKNDPQIQLPVKKEFLRCILSSGQSLLGLVNEVHDFSKIDLNKLNLKNKSFSLQNLANNISTFFVNECEKKGLSFYFDFDETIPSLLMGDELRIKQILYNLLGNGIKFTDNGYLKLSMARGPVKEDKKVNLVIKVEDTGIGIRPENLNKIFDTFEQIDEIIPKEGGSGLGLDITKKIIEKMGGTISVESQYEKGTVFTVELFDLSLALHSSDSKTGDFEEFDYTFYGDTILIADDFEFNLNLIEAYLSPLNLKLEKVKNGLDLIKSAVEIRPSLIITDIKMPSLDGHMAAKKLSQITKTEKIPLIGVSAVQEKESMLNEFDSFLEKPIERSILIKEVAKYLKHKKENVGKNIKDLFLLNEKIEEKDVALLLKMKAMFEETLELQEITELEKNCLRLIKEIEPGSLRSLKEWFEALILELSTFQIDLVNDHLRDAISKINKALKADIS